MQDELLAHVDEHDIEIGALPRGQIHRDNLLHRAVHIYLLDSQGFLHLQKRSATKDTHPLKWECVGGHLGPGEEYLAAAYREVQEELAVELLEPQFLTRLTPSVATGWEFIHVYLGKYAGSLQPESSEIIEITAKSVEDTATWLRQSPLDFTPSLGLSFPFVQSYVTERSNAVRIR